MRLLFLSRWFPYPANNGAKLRIYNLIKSLASQYEIDLISFTEQPLDHTQTSGLEAYCHQVYAIPYKPFQPNSWKARLGFFSLRPRSVIDTFSPEIAQLAHQLSQKSPYDVLIASQVDMAAYSDQILAKTKILEEIELTTLWEQFQREKSHLKRIRKGLMWWKTRRYIHECLRSFNGCTVVSHNERLLMQKFLPKGYPIAVIPNGVDANLYEKGIMHPEPNTLIYLGALSYQANFDAVAYFLQEIFPLIQAKKPDIKFFVTGNNDQALINALPRHNVVQFTGYVEDIRPVVAQSWVSVVPLRLGGGTRLKILEALALGTPVVSTSKGAEGLDLEKNRDILLADNPSAFASAVLRVLDDLTLRTHLADNGRQKVLEHYTWQNIGQELNHFITQLAQ
jgi:glycosyltransferase involved in cell wall biosynthesis